MSQKNANMSLNEKVIHKNRTQHGSGKSVAGHTGNWRHFQKVNPRDIRLLKHNNT